MIRLTSILLALMSLIGCASGGSEFDIVANYPALASVEKIYIDDFGDGEGSDLVREKLLVLLINSQRFSVVETEGNADALLVGSAGVSSRVSNGDTKYAGIGFLRLIDANSRATIWGHQYKRSFMFWGSVSSKVANQFFDQLLEDVSKGTE